jgi:hypothetical protein
MNLEGQVYRPVFYPFLVKKKGVFATIFSAKDYNGYKK